MFFCTVNGTKDQTSDKVKVVTFNNEITCSIYRINLRNTKIYLTNNGKLNRDLSIQDKIQFSNSIFTTKPRSVVGVWMKLRPDMHWYRSPYSKEVYDSSNCFTEI